MSLSLRAALAALAVSPALAVHQGALRISQDGSPLDLHLVALSPKGDIFSTRGSSMTLSWGEEVRGFLALRESDDMLPNNYYNFTLLGKELSYTVDLSAVGCSCNAALFFATMPGRDSKGAVARGSFNPYYCDANKVGGVWCWEHDSIEANRHVVATTPHVCDAPPDSYITSCDRIGCQHNSFEVDPKAVCPDASCTIDSSKPFRIIQRHEANAAMTKLVRISNRFVQGSNTFEFDACNDTAYLEQMTAALSRGMTMVFQLWGEERSTMTWLDGKTGCSGDCNAKTTTVTFSDIALQSLSGDDAMLVI